MTDPRVIEAARAACTQWHQLYPPQHVAPEDLETVRQTIDDAIQRALALPGLWENVARECILKFLAQEPTDKMLLVGCDNTLSHPSFLRATFKMMNAQAAKEIAE